MGTSLVVTVIGNDRPGIVERLSEVVLAAGANWEESRMARLAGKFAGILRINVDAAKADPLASGLRALTSDGLTIVVESSAETSTEAFRTVRLDLVGHVPVRLSVALGTAELTIDRLFSLSASDVIELDSEIDAPVDVRLDGKVIARGMLVASGDNFGVRITEISLEP